MKADRARARFMPWPGPALGPLGAGIAHQLGSDATFQDCRAGSPEIVIIATIIGLLLVAVGALGSWRVYAGKAETPARHLVAVVSLLSCALFGIAIVLPFIAAMVIPQCWA